MKKIEKTKILQYGIILGVVLIISIYILKGTIINTHDGGLHVLRVIGVSESISTGQFPPIIAPSYCNTWGYAVNLFYNPLTTYIPLIISNIIGLFTLGMKIFIILILFLTGIFMYKFVKQVTKNQTISVISACLYILFPYYLSDILIRGAIAEMVALAFLPILFIGLYSLFEEKGEKHYYIAIGGIGLLLTHNITTLYATLMSIIYILFNLKKLKEKEIWKKGIINIIFILIITLFYTVPLIINTNNAEYTIMNHEIMETTGEKVEKRGLNFIDLFKLNKSEDIVFTIGLPNIILLLSTIFTYKKIDTKYKKIYKIFLIMGTISLIMSTKYFPWQYMPDIFSTIQFPWRMLGFAGFFISLINGINLYIIIKYILKEKENATIYISICSLSIIVIYVLMLPYNINGNLNGEKEYEKGILENMSISYWQINREYMPLKAYIKIKDYLKTRDNKISIIQGKADIQYQEKNDLRIEFELKNISENTIIELPYLYYLGYEAKIQKIDGTQEEMNTIESENGFVAIKLPKEEYLKVEVEYRTPTSYYLAYIVSLIGTIIFIIYIIKQKNQKKEEMTIE